MASMSPVVRLAASSARSVARSPSSAPVSPSLTHRRSWIPVRERIHSSLVSIDWESSSLETTRSGTANPVPRNRLRGMVLPAPRASNGPAGPDPGEPARCERPAHAAPGFPEHTRGREPDRPPALRPEAMPLDDAHRRESPAQLAQNGGAEGTWGLPPPRGAHQVPYHARGAPPMVIAHPGDEPVCLPGERDHGVPSRAGDLVGLWRGVHDLEPTESRLDQPV